MKNAKFIKRLKGFTGDAKLYELTPAMEYEDYNGKKHKAKYVIVSAVVVPFCGPETYIFKSNQNGKVKKWGELEGSYKGGLDHSEALENAGYSIV